MKPALSIVIPVYNSERYLDQCFTAILHQGLDLDEFEILAVDDGSSDRSVEVCRSWQNKLPNLTLITQENRGAGAARNAGMDHAQGNYLYFLDADDELIDGALKILLTRCQRDNLDVLFFAGEAVFESEELRREHPGLEHYLERRQAPGITDGETLLIEQEKTGNFCGQPCVMVTRHALALSAGARFAEGVMNEDNIFVLRATLNAKRADTDQAAYYRYHVRSRSVTTSNTSGAKHCLSLLQFAQDFEHERLKAVAAGKPELARSIENLVYWASDEAISKLSADEANATDEHAMCLRATPDLALALRFARELKALRANAGARIEAEERALQLANQLATMKASTSWKVGRAVTALPRTIKDSTRHANER